MSEIRVRIRWRALPFVAVPLYSIVACLQACSGAILSEGEGPDAGPGLGRATSALSCNADEQVKRLSSGDVCCRAPGAGGGPSTCRASGEPQPGDTCSPLGATTPAVSYAATFDVCVEETCAGDRTCTEFPLVVDKQSGTLRCVSDGVRNAWAWDALPTSHVARRACLVAESRVCSGPGYSSATSATYLYTPAYFDGEGESCNTTYPYSSATYSRGTRRLPVRRLFLLGSTCSAAGIPAKPCPLDDL